MLSHLLKNICVCVYNRFLVMRFSCPLWRPRSRGHYITRTRPHTPSTIDHQAHPTRRMHRDFCSCRARKLTFPTPSFYSDRCLAILFRAPTPNAARLAFANFLPSPFKGMDRTPRSGGVTVPLSGSLGRVLTPIHTPMYHCHS